MVPTPRLRVRLNPSVRTGHFSSRSRSDTAAKQRGPAVEEHHDGCGLVRAAGARLMSFHTSVTLLATASCTGSRVGTSRNRLRIEVAPTGREGHALQDKRGGDGRPTAPKPVKPEHGRSSSCNAAPQACCHGRRKSGAQAMSRPWPPRPWCSSTAEPRCGRHRWEVRTAAFRAPGGERQPVGAAICSRRLRASMWKWISRIVSPSKRDQALETTRT